MTNNENIKSKYYENAWFSQDKERLELERKNNAWIMSVIDWVCRVIMKIDKFVKGIK